MMSAGVFFQRMAEQMVGGEEEPALTTRRDVLRRPGRSLASRSLAHMAGPRAEQYCPRAEQYCPDTNPSRFGSIPSA